MLVLSVLGSNASSSGIKALAANKAPPAKAAPPRTFAPVPVKFPPDRVSPVLRVKADKIPSSGASTNFLTKSVPALLGTSETI